MVHIRGRDSNGDDTKSSMSAEIHDVSQYFNDVFSSIGNAKRKLNVISDHFPVDRILVGKIKSIQECLRTSEKRLSDVLVEVLGSVETDDSSLNTNISNVVIDSNNIASQIVPKNRYSTAGEPIDTHIKE